jgi:hypothetical protein
MIFCTACGHPRNGPVRYCTACGAPFPDGGSTEPAAAEQTAGGHHRAAADYRPDTVTVYRPAVGVAVPAHAATVERWQPAGGVAGQDPFGHLLEPRGGGRSGLSEQFGRTAADLPADYLPADYLPADYLPPDYLPPDVLSAPAPGGRRKVAVAVLAATVILIAAAGGLDVWLMHRHHAAPRAAPALTSPAGPASRGTSGSASARAPSPAPAHPAAPAPAISASLFTVAPGVSRNPDASRVETFIGSYFTAINGHNYRQFRRLLGQEMLQQEPATRFYPGYESTTDSAAVLTAISDISPGVVGAAVSFTSHQLPADSPSRSACTNWSIMLYLSQHGSRYVLEPPPPGYRAVYQPC